MFNRALIALVFAIALLSSPPSHAVDRSEEWGLGLDAGAGIPLGPQFFRDNANVGFAPGAHVRYHADSFWGLALSYDRPRFNGAPSVMDAIDLQAFFRLDRASAWTPWLAIGAGDEHLSNYGAAGSYWHLGLKAEAGVEHDLCPQFALGLKAVYHYVTKNDNSLNALVPQLVGTWYFGGKKAEAAPVAAAPEAPKEVAMEKPVPAVKQEFAQKMNAGNAKLDVEFESGKDSLTPSSLPEIEELANYLKSQPAVNVTLEGHTDSSGNAVANKRLSQKRAESVRNVLIEKFGIDASRVKAVGMGAEHPVASNKTKSGKAKNRRVMAEISR